VDTSSAEYGEAGATAFGQLRKLVEAAQAEGFHPDVPPVQLAAVVWASVHGLVQLWLQGALQGAGDRDLDPTLDVMHNVLLGARPAHRSARNTPRRRKTNDGHVE